MACNTAEFSGAVISLSTTQQAVEGRVAKLEGELESLCALIMPAGVALRGAGTEGDRLGPLLRA